MKHLKATLIKVGVVMKTKMRKTGVGMMRVMFVAYVTTKLMIAFVMMRKNKLKVRVYIIVESPYL
jgi:hypothetical protein